ncbi:hypothetical protein JOE50_003526 [Bradyrhizobium japonicum]|nr:hypothetical protein [Bradyrhizobium japonicum]
MTKRKANPRKRGRPPIPELARRRVLARWEHFSSENSRMPPEVRFQRFCLANRDFLRELRISIGDYQVLKNTLSRARKAKSHQRSVRMNRLYEQKLYLDEAAKFALGLPSRWRPLIDPN